MVTDDVLRRLIGLLLPTADDSAVASGSAQPREPDRTQTVDQVADQIVRRYALRCGAVGAVTSVPGMAGTLTALPAGMVSSMMLHLRMILEVARLYGQPVSRESFETDVLLIMAGDATKEYVRQAGVEWSQRSAAHTLLRTARFVAVRSTEPGMGGRLAMLTRNAPLGRLVPLAGAPVGFGVDYAYARAVGQRATAYYRARGAGNSDAAATA